MKEGIGLPVAACIPAMSLMYPCVCINWNLLYQQKYNMARLIAFVLTGFDISHWIWMVAVWFLVDYSFIHSSSESDIMIA
jgi:hypothetical protein